MQSQDSRYHENFQPFSKSRKVILYCYHLFTIKGAADPPDAEVANTSCIKNNN